MRQTSPHLGFLGVRVKRGQHCWKVTGWSACGREKGLDGTLAGWNGMVEIILCWEDELLLDDSLPALSLTA